MNNEATNQPTPQQQYEEWLKDPIAQQEYAQWCAESALLAAGFSKEDAKALLEGKKDD